MDKHIYTYSTLAINTFLFIHCIHMDVKKEIINSFIYSEKCVLITFRNRVIKNYLSKML